MQASLQGVVSRQDDDLPAVPRLRGHQALHQLAEDGHVVELELCGVAVVRLVLKLREHRYGRVDTLPHVPPCRFFIIHGVEAVSLSGHRHHHRVGDTVDLKVTEVATAFQPEGT